MIHTVTSLLQFYITGIAYNSLRFINLLNNRFFPFKNVENVLKLTYYVKNGAFQTARNSPLPTPTNKITNSS